MLMGVLAGAVVAAGGCSAKAGVLREELRAEALAAYEAHGGAAAFRDDIVAIVDLGAHSAQRRFFILDLETGDVEGWHTTHGSGSDADHDGYAESFSNTPGSLASSLGAYRTGERYTGRWGLSLRLDGLQASNDQARARAIVIHPAEYAAPDYIQRFGKAGRSWGCFALPPADNERLIGRLEAGVFLYAAD